MPRHTLAFCLLVAMMVIISACGSQPAPRYIADATATADEAVQINQRTAVASGFTATPTPLPTNTPMPTNTPVPPTNTPTTVPATATTVPPTNTPIPTEAPTDVPTEAPEETDAADAGGEGIEQRIANLVDEADPANGETLWAGGVQPACNTCHNIDSEERLVGPGMAGLYERAASRVDEQGTYEYVYLSMRNSQDHVVEGYPAGVMPQYSEEQLSDEQIYDLMAYIRTENN